MSAWNEYLELLDDLEGLADREAQGIIEADHRYQQESRRLQNEVAAAQRHHKQLVDRNTQLQIGIRSLTRELGVAGAGAGDRQPLTGTALADAMKSAEYDLQQMRRSLSYVEAAPPPVPSIPPTITRSATPATPPDQPLSATRVTNRVAAAISVAAMLVVVAVIALMAL